jgi:putative hydrolase of the HAD superfamily
VKPGIDALLFDLGGVLIRIDFERALGHWASCAGTDPNLLRPRFTFDETLARYECADVLAAEYYANLRRALGIDIPDAEFDNGWNAIFKGPMPGIEPLLDSLRGRIPMHVFSNTNVDHEKVWSSLYGPLLGRFDRIFTSCGIRKRKPTPEAFHAVAQAIDVPPERILFFDDMLANVEGAQAIGMHAAQVRSTADIQSAMARYRFRGNPASANAADPNG